MSAILRRRRGSCARENASAILYAIGVVVVSVSASENLDFSLVRVVDFCGFEIDRNLMV